MERLENQRWSATDVSRMLSILESERRFYAEIAVTLPVPLATVGPGGFILSANRAFQAEFHVGREGWEQRTLDFVFRGAPWRHALKKYEPATVTAGGYHAAFTPIPRWDRGETEWSVVFTAAPESPAPSCAAAEPELNRN
jgi:hypothetical protein